MKMRTILLIFLLAAAGLAACATDPLPELEQARSAYQEVENDARINRYAPVYLYEARQALRKAEAADDREVIEYYAYLAEKNARLAEVTAENKAMEAEVEELRQKRQEILMKAREREALSSRKEAKEAREKARAAEEEKARLKEQMKREKAQLRQEMEELEAEKTDRGYVLTLDDVLFETDEADLLAGSLLRLDELVDFLKRHPERSIRITGYTDSTGSAEYNQDLSRRRALAVAYSLQDQGIAAERMEVRGLGEAYPVATNETAAGRQQNRRVEITILNE
jgi:outer membrane protein OmpA-like peptidoglycan-associated protein